MLQRQQTYKWKCLAFIPTDESPHIIFSNWSKRGHTSFGLLYVFQHIRQRCELFFFYLLQWFVVNLSVDIRLIRLTLFICIENNEQYTL